jgi:hypothetical protein
MIGTTTQTQALDTMANTLHNYDVSLTSHTIVEANLCVWNFTIESIIDNANKAHGLLDKAQCAMLFHIYLILYKVRKNGSLKEMCEAVYSLLVNAVIDNKPLNEDAGTVYDRLLINILDDDGTPQNVKDAHSQD